MFKNATILLALVCVAAIIVVGACGDDDDGAGSNPCEEAAAVSAQAISDYCADKTGDCCYCQCWEGSYGLYDSAAYMADQTCTCSDPPAADESECVDTQLDYANNCLADEAACAEGAVDTAELVCDASPL